MLTLDAFRSLSPWMRGYTVYQCGLREDQPWVKNETNPYPPGSEDAAKWDAGWKRAALDAGEGD